MLGALRPVNRDDSVPPPALGESPTPAFQSQVEVISDYESFVALEAEWNTAVDVAHIPHPFLRHEWVRTWWDSFGSTASLHIVVVRTGGRITAIAPLMRDAATLYGIPARRLAFMANDHTPRTDLIVSGHEDAYQAMWQAIVSDRDWDVLQMAQLSRPSSTLDTFSRLALASGMLTGTWASSDSPYLELEGTWESYWSRLPAKFRSNVRNRLSRLTRIGDPSLEILDGKQSILAACDDVWRLEASGWKNDEGTSIASDPAVRRFYATLAERAADAGWLRLLFLTVGGRRIAVSYGARYADRLFLFKTGYDPEYHDCSPFKVLTYFAIQSAYAQGLREVDFLGDSEPWKREWTSTCRGHEWLFVFSQSRRARLLHSVKFRMAPEIRRWRA